MSCPFGGLRNRSPSRENNEEKTRDFTPASFSQRLRQESFGSYTWHSGPSVDGSSLVGGPPTGVVQQRVSSFLNMIKSSSAPPTLVKQKCPAAKRSLACCRSREAEKDAEELLFPVIRELPDKNQPLTLHRLTEAVWNFITIPVSWKLILYYL